MSNFYCEKCGTAIIDSPNGYITGCEHYLTALQAENKRLREALESIATCNYSDKKATNLEWCKVTAEQALGE